MPKEKEIQAEDAPRPKKWLHWLLSGIALGLVGLALPIGVARIAGYGFVKDGKSSSSDAPAASDNPAASSAPADAEIKVSSTTEVRCGKTMAKDCAHYAADLKEFKQKEEVASLGEEKQLDCTNGRISKNADGTWNVCSCQCVASSQVGKN